jgi:hypothetical protein
METFCVGGLCCVLRFAAPFLCFGCAEKVPFFLGPFFFILGPQVHHVTPAAFAFQGE